MRDRLIEGVRPVRALLKALMALPWKAHAAHPLLQVMHLLHGLYEQDLRALPTGYTVPLGRVWRKVLGGEDRGRAFAAARELLHVLNRGESVNSLKRSIYVCRVAGYQAKQHDEMQAVADALSLLANLVMAWNTMKMQTGGNKISGCGCLDRPKMRRESHFLP